MDHSMDSHASSAGDAVLSSLSLMISTVVGRTTEHAQVWRALEPTFEKRICEAQSYYAQHENIDW